MSSCRVGACAAPLHNALLISAATHLLVLTAGGFQTASVVDSANANKKLPALNVSVTRAPESPEVRHPTSAGHPQAVIRPVDRPAVLATADTASTLPASEVIEATTSGGGATGPRTLAAGAAPSPVDVSVARGQVVASGGEMVLPDGYLDAVRGYRIALASRAKRLYPPAAREMGIGGRSEIEIVVPVANSPEFRVRQSSGHEELDRAALEMLRRSVELVELPSLLRGRRLSISLPVEFLPPP